ncbi:MAG: hypothetical protein D6732_04820 [Methanobacteriota archaeon]|nr:MAG: hypothetical protein D6732_04820 [Euryarchaeota archaeon]
MNDLASIEKVKSRIEIKGRAREFVFGMQDGLISILGLVSGIYGAYPNEGLIVAIIGITGAIAAAISMAVGSLLSSEAERDLLLAEIQESYEVFEKEPYLAQESLLDMLVEKGLDKPTAYKVVKIISTNKSVLFENFKDTVLELPSVEEENPYLNAVVMFVAFVIGALFPVVPFLVSSGKIAYYSSIVATSTALFSLGFVKGYLAKHSPLKSGLKFFFIAVVAGLLSESIGNIVSIIYS